MIEKLLVANRGEIAVRIFKAAASLGVETVAVCSEADRDALFTTLSTESTVIGGGPATESYLNQDAVIAAALESGSDAITPRVRFPCRKRSFCTASVGCWPCVGRAVARRHEGIGTQDSGP